MIGCMEKVPDLEDLWPQPDFCGVISFDDQTVETWNYREVFGDTFR